MRRVVMDRTSLLNMVVPLDLAIKIKEGQELILLTYDMHEKYIAEDNHIDTIEYCNIRSVKMWIPPEGASINFVRFLSYGDTTGKPLSSWEYYWDDYFKPYPEGVVGYTGSWGLKLVV